MKREIRKLMDRLVAKPGKKISLKDYDPDWTGSIKDKKEALELLENGVKQLAKQQDKLYAQDTLLAADDLPGDGRGRQGRHDPARHVRRQPAGLPGVQLQGAVSRGTRSRLPVADR